MWTVIDGRIWDIETLKEMFCIDIYNFLKNEWRYFEISKTRNDLDALVKYLEENKGCYWIGFNNIEFDAQVLQFILENHEKWVDLPVLTDYTAMYQVQSKGDKVLYYGGIINRIYDFSQECISRSNNDLFPVYREENLWAKQIDLFTVHHFDNENKRTSLKWVAYMLGIDVEDMPIHHTRLNLTPQEEALIRKYCRNDVKVTYELWRVTVGDTELAEYKGENKIQDRLNYISKYGFPDKAISWSDVKIGDEIILLGYCRLTGRTRKDVYELKKKRKAPKKLTFGDCIPNYVSFTTPELILFKARVEKERVHFFEKQEFKLDFRGTVYTVAKGGIHSNEKSRILVTDINFTCRDADIGSQYPNAIYKRNLYPAHLGVEWNRNAINLIEERISLKPLAEKDPLIRSAVKGLKLALNGGLYGKTKEVNSWMYGPAEVTFPCTIGNQFEILMLIEMLELKGIHVVSANTDGIVSMVPTGKDDLYYKICEKWEKKVGNDKMGKLEYADYEKIYQTSVNDYIAIKKGGKVKRKGDFKIDFLLNENKSRRIVPLALGEYFTKGTPVEDFIMNHKDVRDFDICVKASKDYRYEFREIGSEDCKPEDIYHRLVRYIVTTDGKILLKIKNENSEAPGNAVTKCEAGKERVLLCTEINTIDPMKNIAEYNIDYQYYIDKAKKVINALESRSKKAIVDPNQMSLF